MSGLRELPDWWTTKVLGQWCAQRDCGSSAPLSHTLSPMPMVLLSCSLYHKPVTVFSWVLWILLLNHHTWGGGGLQEAPVYSSSVSSTWDLRLESYLRTICGTEPWHLWICTNSYKLNWFVGLPTGVQWVWELVGVERKFTYLVSQVLGVKAAHCASQQND